MKVTCKFCRWEAKTSGVWESHHAARAHMEQAHPEEFKKLLDGEEKVQKLMQDTYTTFGLAAKFKYY